MLFGNCHRNTTSINLKLYYHGIIQEHNGCNVDDFDIRGISV